MSKPVLHLRAEEKTLFDGLPDGLKDGWKVEEEKLENDERPEELDMRYRIARFDNPVVKDAVDSARKAKTPEEFEKTASSLDISEFPPDLVAEFFFTIGTKLTGAIISYFLSQAKSDEDIEGIAGLTEIRHMLLEANASVPS